MKTDEYKEILKINEVYEIDCIKADLFRSSENYMISKKETNITNLEKECKASEDNIFEKASHVEEELKKLVEEEEALILKLTKAKKVTESDHKPRRKRKRKNDKENECSDGFYVSISERAKNNKRSCRK
nr:uncharacterized protein LOC122272641 isoform X3 [Parasteatoda tepidariorum]